MDCSDKETQTECDASPFERKCFLYNLSCEIVFRSGCKYCISSSSNLSNTVMKFVHVNELENIKPRLASDSLVGWLRVVCGFFYAILDPEVSYSDVLMDH